MSTKDDALIEKMLEEYHRCNFTQWKDVPLTSLQKQSVRRDMRAALAVARKAMLEEAITACDDEHLVSPNGDADEAYDRAVDDCIDRLRSLSTQEQPK